MDLLDWAETHARRGDPDTSHNAARASRGLASEHCRIIYDALRDIGPATADELAAFVDLDRYQIRRRTADLQAAGKIRDTGERHKTPAGRPAIVWAAVEAG